MKKKYLVYFTKNNKVYKLPINAKSYNHARNIFKAKNVYDRILFVEIYENKLNSVLERSLRKNKIN